MRIGQRNQSVHFSATTIVFFLICIAISSWTATQYFASSVQYQDGLGESVFRLGPRIRVYQPFAWVNWASLWINEAGLLGTYVERMLLMVSAGIVASLGAGFYLYYRRSLKTETPTDLHGSSRWAEIADIQKMRLVSYERKLTRWKQTTDKWQATGPYVGAIDVDGKRLVMRYSDPAHILVDAPSRSGKGVGPVLCTLLSYPNSTYGNDIKGELYALSSGFRHAAGTLVMRFDPTTIDAKSIDGVSRYNDGVCWNAIAEIRLFTDYDVMDAQNLAKQLADPKGEGMDDHWVSTSYELLTGIVLHVAYYERDKTLNGCATYLADPSFTDPEQMFLRMLDAEHDPQLKMGWKDSMGNPTKTNPQVALAARAMLNKEEKERNSVLSTAKTKLSLYTEPIVARNTSRSDFKLDDLMNHDKPVSFYQIVPPGDKGRLTPLIRLFISFALTRFASGMEFEDGRSVKSALHRLLMMLDELPSLGKLEVLPDTLGYLAGYGITVMAFVQDRLQLKDIYGDNETISAGCQLQISYAPNTTKSAEEISQKTGKMTEKRQNVSYSGTRMGAMLGQMSISEELHERNLMTPDEVSRMDRDRMIVFNTGHPPILAWKLKYYEMDVFQKRAEMPTASKVTLTYIGDDKMVASNWFMVSCHRREASKDFDLSINVYREFPVVSLVVKQLHLERDEVMEFEYRLQDTSGNEVARPIELDDLDFVAAPVGDVTEFDPREAFEMHFIVKDTSGLRLASQTGFYRDISIWERALRRAVRKYFKELEEKEGKPFDPTVRNAELDARYTGTVLLANTHYIALQRNNDVEQITLHRIQKLDKEPKVGEAVTIKYKGKQGAVNHVQP
jgi:type IV secretion system protein VirD4